MPTYKKEYPMLVENILTECDIYSVSGHKFHVQRALWDTGADTTIISSRIVKELNLQPYKAGGISGIGGATGSNVYSSSPTRTVRPRSSSALPARAAGSLSVTAGPLALLRQSGRAALVMMLTTTTL